MRLMVLAWLILLANSVYLPVVTNSGGPGGQTLPTAAATLTPVPTATQTPTPTNTPVGQNCHPSYPTLCVPPPPPDLSCGDVGVQNFPVTPPDPHGFDRDEDGIGCESGEVG